MRLAVFSVVRNEADILGAFLRHVLSLFDYAILVDHRSLDGSGDMLRAACNERPGWRCWRAEYEGHHQKQAAAIGLRQLFQHTDADFVCLLDADEFIDVPDRTRFEHLFDTLENPEQVGQFFWRNCLPTDLGRDRLAIGDLIRISPVRSMFSKIVIPRGLWNACGAALGPTMGYHAIEPLPDRIPTYRPLGDLLHVPLRSRAQMERKVVLNWLAELARANRPNGENVHWRQVIERMSDGGIGDADLIGCAADYGHPDRPIQPMDQAALDRAGFAIRPLDVAAVPPLVLVAGAPVDPLRAMASALRQWRIEDPDTELRLDRNVLRLSSDDAGRPPGVDPVSQEAPELRRLHSALSACEAEIAELNRALAAAAQDAEQAQAGRSDAEAEIRVLRSSTSFRITAPMRIAMASIRRIRGRLLESSERRMHAREQ